MKVLLIMSGVALAGAIVLLILHFTNDIDAFWFSIPLAVGITLNLINSIINLKKTRKKEQEKDENQN